MYLDFVFQKSKRFLSSLLGTGSKFSGRPKTFGVYLSGLDNVVFNLLYGPQHHWDVSFQL